MPAYKNPVHTAAKEQELASRETKSLLEFKAIQHPTITVALYGRRHEEAAVIQHHIPHYSCYSPRGSKGKKVLEHTKR